MQFNFGLKQGQQWPRFFIIQPLISAMKM